MSDMSRPLVSVVPTYRRAHYNTGAVSGARAQTCGDVEVIVVADGSRDVETELREYRGQLRHHWQENRGAGAGRNACAKLARDRWLASLGDDDRWKRDKLERQVAVAEAHTQTRDHYTARNLFLAAWQWRSLFAKPLLYAFAYVFGSREVRVARSIQRPWEPTM